MKKIVLISALAMFSLNSFAYSPYLVSPDGTYLGTLNDNKYDPDSVSNPYGKYGSKYSADSINNPYGTYGSKYSDKSSNNPYATSAPKIYGR